MVVWILVVVFWRYVSLARSRRRLLCPFSCTCSMRRGHAPPYAVSAGASFGHGPRHPAPSRQHRPAARRHRTAIYLRRTRAPTNREPKDHEKNRHHRRGKLRHGAGRRARPQPPAAPPLALGARRRRLAGAARRPRKLRLPAGHAHSGRHPKSPAISAKRLLARRSSSAWCLPRTPARRTRAMLPHLDAKASRNTIFVSATKGLEHDSLARMSEVIAEVIGEKFAPRLAVLSGPSFALEVARGDPTAVVIASPRFASAPPKFRSEFSGSTLRLYTNDDVVGVEVGRRGEKRHRYRRRRLCRTGLGRKHHRRAGDSRSFRNDAAGDRLLAAGAIPLPGSPVLATCAYGYRLAKPQSFGRRGIGQGPHAAPRSCPTCAWWPKAWAQPPRHLRWRSRHRVEMPITEQMYAVLHQGRSPNAAIRELMERHLKKE